MEEIQVFSQTFVGVSSKVRLLFVRSENTRIPRLI